MKAKIGRVAVLGVLLALSLLGLSSASAFASTAEEINVLPTLDPLNRAENPLSNGSKWSALSWAAAKGQDTTGGWGPSNAFSTVDGAYWNPATLSDKTGDAAAITMQTLPGGAERYVSLWLNMPSAGSAKSGYQLRWTVTSGSTFAVKLSKWSAGTETVLASNSSVSIPAGTTMAISDTGETVTAWQGTGGSLTSILSVNHEGNFSSGSAGIEGSGNLSRSTNFKAGALLGGAISGIPVLDNFERNEVPLANGKWSKSSWAASIGGAWCCATYRGFGSSGSLAGAYWNPTPFTDVSGGVLVAATVGTGSPAGQYQALWLNAPNPGTAQSGYEARFTGVSGSTYKVELSKWVSGTRTVLGTKEGFSLAVGTTMALSESGGSLVLWAGSGSAFTPVLSATDTTYTSGYAGIDVNGGAGTAYNFKAGGLVQPPDTTISNGSSAGTVPPNVAFSFTASEGGTTFECSMDGAAYGTCTSPKSYQGLSEGSHTFRVRAVGAAGADQTPAERTVQVAGVNKVPLLDNLSRDEIPIATGKWTKDSWASEIGGVWNSGGYHGFGSNTTANSGAYWNPNTFSDGSEGAVFVAETVGTGSRSAGEYQALWLNMPNPGSARSGYEARFAGVDGSTNYKVELSKWVSGTRTVLASTTGFSLPNGTTAVLSESGGNLTLWSGTSSFSQVLSAIDSTYSSGYAGLEVNGVGGSQYNFRAGHLDTQAPDTTITSGPTGTVLPESVSFTFTATESGSTFECSMDAGSYSACTSPKAYPTITSGSHTFRVRATDPAANQDATPAERSFQVIQPPSGSTGSATAIKSTTATLNATVNPNGSSTTYQFEYGTTTSYGSKVPATAKNIGSGSTGVEASEPVTGLSAGTTYHFRISATNAAGTTKGSDQTFTTTAAPVATTEAATGLSAKEGTLNASVNPKGAATTYQFEYGPTTSYGNKVPASAKAIGSGSGAVAVSEIATGLTEGSVYHYRVVAANEVGTTYGADKTMTTPYLPNAITEPADGIDPNEAILNSTVDPNASETTYQFEYGKTAAYGSVVPSNEEEVGNASEWTEGSEAITHLEPETTYHYRVIAKSQAGTVIGADKTFTTPASSVSPQHEAEEANEEIHFTGKFTGGLPAEFMGMMWSGDKIKTLNSGMMNAVKHSGANIYRMALHPNIYNENEWKSFFQQAANRGIRILPDVAIGWADEGEKQILLKFTREMVEKFGPNGSYWANNSGADRPVTAWELGNEPNLASNTTHPGDPYTKARAEEFGDHFAEYAAAARNGAQNRGQEIEVLLAGLFTTGPTGCHGEGSNRECSKEAADFIEDMGHNSSYDAVSVHPYVFKVGKNPHAPNCGPEPQCNTDLTDAANRVYSNIDKVRNALRNENENNKEIWVTELGFPTDTNNPSTFPSVTEGTQEKLIDATFNRIKANHKDLGVSHLFYYNIQDDPNKVTWDYRSGLRRGKGKNRPAWEAYARQASGDPNWPPPVSHKNTHSGNVKGKRADFISTINNAGSGTQARFQFWKPAANPNVIDTASAELEGLEEDQNFERLVTGLQPETEYRFHAVATNENEETTVGETQEFKTPPSSSTSTNVKRVLHGQPGWVWVDGWVKEGYIEGPGPGLGNVHVHVKLFRNGVFQRFVDVMTNGEGHYDSGYIEVGSGDWEVASEFPGGGEWDASESPNHQTFTVRDGVRIRAKHSDKCMDIYGAESRNGAPVMHGECNEPPSANQVFTLAPMGDGQYFQIIARNSGKCVDVDNASTADGAGLQQYDCLGANQANQLFREAWWGETPYTSYVAKHSQKCLDVTGGNLGWTNMQQWTCNENFQQRFRLEPVESAPIPTETSFTTDHIIHGNGQYGNWGLIGFHGNLKAGAYNMENRVVQVEFEKLEGSNYVWKNSLPLTVNWEGAYHYGDYGLAPGIWRVRAHFMGSGEFGESASAWHDFSIFQANRLVARHSDKCLTLSENKNVNGQQLIQWECVGTGSMQDGQSFWFWPLGNNIYNITVISSGKCLDIRDGSTSNGALLQQWDCNGNAQQKWELLPIAGQDGWYALRPQNSNKCLDVYGAETRNGATVWQWDCHWEGNQQWEIRGVVGG